jgi:hypothetical protein
MANTCFPLRTVVSGIKIMHPCETATRGTFVISNIIEAHFQHPKLGTSEISALIYTSSFKFEIKNVL